MSRERYGPWEEVSLCTECGEITAKERKWTSGFFTPVCPRCGADNGYRSWDSVFRAVTARRVTTWWGRYLRTEFKDPERVARLRAPSLDTEDDR